jgi:hypothetical protein
MGLEIVSERIDKVQLAFCLTHSITLLMIFASLLEMVILGTALTTRRVTLLTKLETFCHVLNIGKHLLVDGNQ